MSLIICIRALLAVCTGLWYGWEINFYFVRQWKFFFGTALSITHSDNFSVKSDRIIPEKFIKNIKYCDIWNLPFKILEKLWGQYIYIFFSNKLHYMKEFPETTQKAFEVQLTLGCKAEKEKYRWKSELLQSHSLNLSSKMLASESFLTIDVSGKLRSSHWRGGLVLFCSRFWSKNILE